MWYKKSEFSLLFISALTDTYLRHHCYPPTVHQYMYKKDPIRSWTAPDFSGRFTVHLFDLMENNLEVLFDHKWVQALQMST